jgi:deazaflavin-dependent oxidoreductase (nitroreductase family)
MKDQPVKGYQRIARKVFSIRPVVWLLSHTAHVIDRFLMSLTNSRYSVAGLLAGVPVITLTTTGAKSGRPRTVPLLGIPDGEKMILIASNWGQGRHPAWYYNIRANHAVQVGVNGRTIDYVAHEAKGEERQGYWQTAVQVYPGYAAYKKWTDGREIPVIVLVRKS